MRFPRVSFAQANMEHKYLLIRPDVGLFFPAVDFLANKISDIAEDRATPDTPVVVIDCQRFRGIDYTAIKVRITVYTAVTFFKCVSVVCNKNYVVVQGLEKLAKDFKDKDLNLWFINLNAKVVRSIGTLGDLSKLKILKNETEVIALLSGLGNYS